MMLTTRKVESLGFSSERTQLISVIPYAMAFVTMNIIGQLSDRFNNKGYFVLGAFVTCLIGLIVLISTTGQVSGMAGVCLMIIGLYTAAVVLITWVKLRITPTIHSSTLTIFVLCEQVQISFAGRTKRAVVAGITQLCGQGTSIAAAHFYTDPPYYRKGHAILICFNVAALIATAIAQHLMRRENNARDKEMAAYTARGEVHPGVQLSIEDTCDKHITFRYVL